MPTPADPAPPSVPGPRVGRWLSRDEWRCNGAFNTGSQQPCAWGHGAEMAACIGCGTLRPPLPASDAPTPDPDVPLAVAAMAEEGGEAWESVKQRLNLAAPTPAGEREGLKPEIAWHVLSGAFAASINRYSAEQFSNTPDFVLGEFLATVLAAFDVAVNERTRCAALRAAPSGAPVAWAIFDAQGRVCACPESYGNEVRATAPACPECGTVRPALPSETAQDNQLPVTLDITPEGKFRLTPNAAAPRGERELPYDAVSVNGRAREWKVPLWDAINARDWKSDTPHAAGRVKDVIRVEQAVEQAMRLAVECAAPLAGTWPADSIQRAFVAGAKWWEFRKSGATMWPTDQHLAEVEAIRRYGEPAHPGAPDE